MGVDYDSYVVIGYKIEMPEEYECNVDEYLDKICKEVNGNYICTGNHYTGYLNYYIVPKSYPRDLPSLLEAINDLPRLEEALRHTDATYDSEPYVGALGNIS